MANAILFYRTPTRRKIDSPYATPQLLLQNSPENCLEFTFAQKQLDGARKRYENNVKSIPASNPDGVKRVNKQENGMSLQTLIIRGFFKNPEQNAELLKLDKFGLLPQVDSYHRFGIIGFHAPNSVRLSLDPTDTIGYTIDYIEYGHIGQKHVLYDFEVGLSLGGTIPLP